MNKKSVLAGIPLLVLISGAIVFSTQEQELKPSGSPQNPTAWPLQKGEAGVPDHIFYDHVFNSILRLKNPQDYKNEAGLDDTEVRLLARVAEECVRDLAQQDEKAMVLIKAFRARTKSLKPGNALPPPPAELKAMQKTRNAIVLRHRDRLRTLLGDTKLDQFKAAAQRIVQIEIKTLP